MRIRAVFFFALALVLAQTSFAGTVAGSGGTISSCTNWPGSPTDIGGDLYTQFTCSLYGDVSSYTFDLTPLLTEGGALLSVNAVVSAYVVVINGDPGSLPDDSTGLYNQSLWQTVLFSPGDQGAGYTSDRLTVYWPGAFPLAATVQSFDRNLWGYVAPDATFDPFFFVKSTGFETVYTPDLNEYEFDIYTTPEPGTIALLGSGLALLGGAVLKRRRTAGRAA